ncbi:MULTISPECIES: sigma-70 family RNA polymerase sigma factor [Streptomyces]|uniref:sigma-70 family RNA polymerase sigma factor n=1 Tax=Streptomyces TaxID=1883 RepID=UPI0010511E67|nr:sigma-70 family RNA polymerase sigma factor [Streptomyces sp. BK205]TCR16374.1 RNA polymerase sigma-70 factor (ECF subfamily) [Streptomyces sp. BK205]
MDAQSTLPAVPPGTAAGEPRWAVSAPPSAWTLPEVAPGEEELARGLLAGDEACLTLAYHRWSPLVHTLARRSLGDPSEAEDVTQQVFIGLWRGRRGYRPERGTLGGWIVGITRRKVADALRARSRRFDLAVRADARVVLPPHTEDRTEATVDGLVVRAELAKLPSAQQRVLRLTFYEDLSQIQIAERTGWPLGTVKSHARRGMHRLRRGLEFAFDAETVR